MDSEILPSYFELTIEFRAEASAAALAQRLFADVSKLGFGKVVKWKLGAMSGSSRDCSFEQLAVAAAEKSVTKSFHIETDQHFHIQVARGLGGRSEWQASCLYFESDEAPNPEWLHRMVALVKSQITQPDFLTALLERASLSTASFPPSPPLARTNHLIVTSENEVEECYDEPEIFWEAWDDVEAIGNHRLCTRALDEIDEPSWLAYTFEDHMALARAAKAGLTKYGRVFFDDWMRKDWWDSGEPTLRKTYYDEDSGLLEFTCLPDPGEHVLIREIHGMRQIVKTKKDFDGNPVKRVRVLFLDESAAQAEKRPLLDVGAEVCYLDPDGDDEPVPVS